MARAITRLIGKRHPHNFGRRRVVRPQDRWRKASGPKAGGFTRLGKRTLLLSMVSSALAFAAPGPLAAQSYPDKPIKIIVTVAAGGPMDTIARFVGPQMQAP